MARKTFASFQIPNTAPNGISGGSGVASQTCPEGRRSRHHLATRNGYCYRNGAGESVPFAFREYDTDASTAQAEGYEGYWIRIQQRPTGTEHKFWALDDNISSSDAVNGYVQPDGTLKFYNVGTATEANRKLIFTTSGALPLGEWAFLEIHWKFNTLPVATVVTAPADQVPVAQSGLRLRNLVNQQHATIAVGRTTGSSSPGAGSTVQGSSGSWGGRYIDYKVSSGPTGPTDAFPAASGFGSNAVFEVWINGVSQGTMAPYNDTADSLPPYNAGLHDSAGDRKANTVGLSFPSSGANCFGLWLDLPHHSMDTTARISANAQSTILLPNGNGTHTGWTNAGDDPDFRSKRVPLDGGFGRPAGTNVSGAKISWTLPTPASLGITNIKAARLCWYASSGASANAFLIRNGNESAASGGAWTAGFWRSQFIDASGWAPTDTLEVGATCNAASLHRVLCVCLIIEHETDVDEPDDDAVRILTGQYSGTDANATIDLAALDPAVATLLPSALIVGANAVREIEFWTDHCMGAHGFNSIATSRHGQLPFPEPGKFHVCYNATAAQSLSTSGTTYFWIAIFDPQHRVLKRGYSIGTTTPATTDNRNITYKFPSIAEAASFAALFAMLWRETAATADANTFYFRGPGHVGDLSSRPATSTTPLADAIQAINVGGLQLGTLVDHEGYGVSFIAGADTFYGDALFDAGFYDGDGTGPRVVPLALGGKKPFLLIHVPHAAATRTYRFDGDTTARTPSGSVQANAIDLLANDAFTAGSTNNASGVRYSYIAFASGVDEAPGEVTFPPGGTIDGKSKPQWWLEMYWDDTQENVSDQWLDHEDDYFGGPKYELVISITPIKRQASDFYGTPAYAGWRVELSDKDRRFRKRIDTAAKRRRCMNRTGIVRLIQTEDALLGNMPRIVGIGVIQDLNPLPGLTFYIDFKDITAQYAGPGAKEPVVPKAKYKLDAQNASLPASMDGQPVQICLGDLVDGASFANPPTLNGDPAHGSFFMQLPPNLTGFEHFPASFWFMGWAPIPGSLPAPVLVTAALAPGGEINKAETLGGFYIQITAIDAAGLESDPHIFNTHQTTRVDDWSAGDVNMQLDVDWNAVTGAVAYRVYVGYDFFNLVGGLPSAYYIEVAAPTTNVTFEKIPPHGTAADADNITAGGSLITYVRSAFYKVVANVAAGPTGASMLAWTKIFPYPRPAEIKWDPVAGATSYDVFKTESIEDVINNQWGKKFNVLTASFIDDFSDSTAEVWSGPIGAIGKVRLRPVGTRQGASGRVWYEFEVSCCFAIKSIDAIFVDGWKVDEQYLGEYCLIPGKAGYAAEFPTDQTIAGSIPFRVVTIDGRQLWRTSVYGAGDLADAVYRGEKILAANLHGVVDEAGTTITDLFQQYKFIARNLMFGDQRTGALAADAGPFWPDSEVWGTQLPIVDEDAFDACSAQGALEVAGGFTGAIVLGGNEGQTSFAELQQRLNIAGFCFSVWTRKFQFAAKKIDRTIDLATTLLLEQTVDLKGATFSSLIDVSAFVDIARYQHLYDFARSQWMFKDKERTHDVAISESRAERPGDLLDFRYTANITQVEFVLASWLEIMTGPPMLPEFVADLVGTSLDIGDTIRLTHDEGPGEFGYVEAPLFVLAHALDLMRMKVYAQHLDLKDLIEPTSVVVEEEGYVMTGWLGGSKIVSLPTTALTVLVNNWVPFEIDWTRFATWTVRLRVECRTANAGTSVQPQLWNETDAVEAALGAACTATLDTYLGANQRQTIVVAPAAGAKNYVLRAIRNNNTNDTFMQGYLEFIP